MLRALALLLAASAGAAAPVPKGIKDTKPTLNGRWELVEQNESGKNNPNFSKWMWVIDGDKLSFCRPDPAGVYQPSETRQQATIVPAPGGGAGEMDYTLTNGNAITLYRTRVELNGDELRVCFENTGNAERPAEVKAGGRVLYFRFKRVEK